MSSNRDILVEKLTAMPVLDRRFSQLECVNYDPASGEKRGTFSLVFKCIDNGTGRHAALKFFDPEHLGDVYRLHAFRREPDILKRLMGKHRCLQLVQGLQPVAIQIPVPAGQFRVDCDYFAVEWIDADIEDYFQQQHAYDAATKLDVFRDIVLATEALHKWGVYHRDLKPDNFRAIEEEGHRLVIAVDMGTAARYDVDPSITPTIGPVGATWYSSPEAYCGLARIRSLARYTDIYALGCMLYELFNRDCFSYVQHKDPAFAPTLAALAIDQMNCRNDEEKVSTWCSSVTSLKRGVIVPTMTGSGSSCPLSIGNELDFILKILVGFDFRDRCDDLEKVRTRVESAIRVVKHRTWDCRRREERKRRRECRLKRQADKLKWLIDRGKKRELTPC
ncbi:MAG: protein kinase family protein [Phycisphaerae bacterium]|nr:protein kinase family protein [Phycisphaerae bacterium]